MTEEKRSAPGGKPRRRHVPQIDLTATEIKSEPQTVPSEPQAAEAASEHPNTDTAPESPKSSTPPPLAPGRSPAMAYAVIGGAAVAAVIVGGGLLWMAGNPPQSSVSAEVNTRLAALETQIRELAQRPVPQSDTRAIDALMQRLAKVEETAARPAPTPVVDSALTERLGALETGIAALNRRAEALQSAAQQAPRADAFDVVAKRLDAIEQSARSTQDKVAQNASSDTAARRVLAALTLRDTAARGAPFTAELAAVKALGGDTQSVAALESFAAGGIPNDAVLSRELSALLPSIIAAANADPARSGGFLEKLEANASKLVRIRPLGEPAGDDPAAVLARIEVKLSRNDIAGADKEIAALPEKARAIADAWRKKVAARSAALDASRKLAADGVAALAR